MTNFRHTSSTGFRTGDARPVTNVTEIQRGEPFPFLSRRQGFSSAGHLCGDVESLATSPTTLSPSSSLYSKQWFRREAIKVLLADPPLKP